MTAKSLVRRGALLVVGCVFMLQASGAYGFQQPGKLEVLHKARASYYSLKLEGMAGFQCDMSPNWASLLADQRKTNPEAIDTAIERLKRIHFSVSVGPDGAAKVSHNEIAADN